MGRDLKKYNINFKTLLKPEKNVSPDGDMGLEPPCFLILRANHYKSKIILRAFALQLEHNLEQML